MGSVRRIAVVSAFVLFILAIGLRPLASNPLLVDLLEGGITDLQTAVLVLFVLVPATLLVAARLTAARRDHDPTSYRPADRTHQDERFQRDDSGAAGRERSANEHSRVETKPVDAQEYTSAEDGPDAQERAPTEHGPDAQERAPAEDQPQAQEQPPGPDRPDFLSGQGGTRNREFVIEERPPDASLRDHLEHLEAALDDDESKRDLEGLEVVAEETESPPAVPARCPGEYCDAAWTERGILGIGSGRYELLEEESTVICLECEGEFPLPEETE